MIDAILMDRMKTLIDVFAETVSIIKEKGLSNEQQVLDFMDKMNSISVEL